MYHSLQLFDHASGPSQRLTYVVSLCTSNSECNSTEASDEAVALGLVDVDRLVEEVEVGNNSITDSGDGISFGESDASELPKISTLLFLMLVIVTFRL